MTVHRSLAQQEEYRMRDGDAGGREPGTRAARNLLTAHGHRPVEGDEPDQADNLWCAADDESWPCPFVTNLLLVEAEARQQGRDREARDLIDRIAIRLSQELVQGDPAAVVMRFVIAERLTKVMDEFRALASADDVTTSQIDKHQRGAAPAATSEGSDASAALASADGPPEPPR